MNCIQCNQAMSSGTSKCEIGVYNIYDNSGTLDFQWRVHNISSDDDEIGTEVSCYYCKTCSIVEHLSGV